MTYMKSKIDGSWHRSDCPKCPKDGDIKKTKNARPPSIDSCRSCLDKEKEMNGGIGM